MIRDVVAARGHPNVLSTHKTTLEFTKETHLTPRGDCIIAVGADKSLGDLKPELLEVLRNPGTKIKIKITCGGISDTVTAYGHPGLSFTHPTDAVLRKSEYVCSRTLAVNADKAALDLGRGLVEKLACGLPVTIEIRKI
ncbi:MAG: DUF371 domain-containing protein [Candidatus Altiarchaeota archaeon]